MVFKENILESNSGSALFKIFHTTVDPGRRVFREHHHTAFEIAFFLSGSGTYKTKNTEYSYRKGDIFCFSCNEIHCITNISNAEPLNAINIHFEPRLIWSDKFSDMSLLRIFTDRNDKFQNMLDRANPSTKMIADLFLEIEQEFEEKRSGFETAVRIKLLSILLIMNRNYGYVNEVDDSNFYSKSYPLIEKTINFIDENIACDMTLDELSDMAGMNRSYFCTLFKKLNGITPWDYITIRRIEKSIEFLKEGKYTILETALKCGFNNSSNFYYAFKKITGKTPGDYKENNNE